MWRVAASLTQLLSQVNALAPRRRKDSDGTIGDPSHQGRESDHNPWVKDGSMGVVTAMDITHDPDHGCDGNAIVASILQSRDRRVKYVIFNRQMWRSYDKTGLPAWTAAAYTGPNAHAHHVHISVLDQKRLYDDVGAWDLGPLNAASPRVFVGGSPSPMPPAAAAGLKLAWGRKVSPAFKGKVIDIAARLRCDPNDLMAAMAFESARSFSPSIQNPYSKATGLIQFMPATATGLGTSTAALAAMTAEAQLDYVHAFLKPWTGRLADIYDLYMAILWPKAVGQPKSYVLFSSPSKAYQQNRGLDGNNDGTITKAEAANRVVQELVEGMRSENLG